MKGAFFINPQIKASRDLLEKQAYEKYYGPIKKILDDAVRYFVENPTKSSIVMPIPDNTVACYNVLESMASKYQLYLKDVWYSTKKVRIYAEPYLDPYDDII